MVCTQSQLYNFIQGCNISGESAFDIYCSLYPNATKEEFLEFLRSTPGPPGESPVITLEETASGVLIEATSSDGTNSIAYVLHGDRGPKGEEGKSAYQVWLDAGNSGTEQEFLNYLKSNITIDSSLSGTSTNPVQNKVVSNKFNHIEGVINNETFKTSDIIPVQNGGLGVNNIEAMRKLILGYDPVWLKLTIDESLPLSTSYNTCFPFASITAYSYESNSPVMNSDGYDASHPIFIATHTVTVGDRSNMNIVGIQIGHGVKYVRISATVRYNNNSDNGTIMHTYLNKVLINMEDGSVSTEPEKCAGASDYMSSSTNYISQHIDTILPVEENEFIFLNVYKSKNIDIDVTAAFKMSNFIVEVVG